jgi:hypothetical protein
LIHPPLSNPKIGIRAGSFRKQFNHWKEIMDYFKNGVLIFNGQNGLKYEMWSRRMKVFLQEHGNYIWLSVVTGYDSSKREKTASKKELKKNKKIAMDFIEEGLPNPVREKVGKFSSAKELWDKLHDIYSSPIANSKNVKEDADTDQEELCSPCQTDSEDEEYIITRGMLFCFNCEKHGHLEIEFHEGNETEKLIEKEDNYEEKMISVLDELREENKPLKKELMKQKESVHIF